MSGLVGGSERYSKVEHKGDDFPLKCGNLRFSTQATRGARASYQSPSLPFSLSISSPPAPSSPIMSAVPSASTSHSDFASIFNTAFETYKRKTRKDLAKLPLYSRLRSCDSPEAILTVLREQFPAPSQSQDSDDQLTKWVAPTVNVLYSFSATLGGVAGLVNIRMFSYDTVLSNLIFTF